MLCAAAKYIDGFADWYCENVYKPAAGALGTVTGAFPLSLMELGIAAAVLVIIALSIGAARRAQKDFCRRFGGFLPVCSVLRN